MCSSNLNRFSSKMFFLGSGRGQGKGRKDCSFALSWMHRLTWDKTIPLFVVILRNGWICFFINLLIPWLAGTTITRQYGSSSTLLEHLWYTVIWVAWWIKAIIMTEQDRSRLGFFFFHFHFKWKQFWLPIRLSMLGIVECYTFSSCFLVC